MTARRLPLTRAECIEGPRPCPHVTCRHHLWLDAKKGTRLADMPETCALDVADRGGVTLPELGELLGVTKERAMQLEKQALAKVVKRGLHE